MSSAVELKRHRQKTVKTKITRSEDRRSSRESLISMKINVRRKITRKREVVSISWIVQPPFMQKLWTANDRFNQIFKPVFIRCELRL